MPRIELGSYVETFVLWLLSAIPALLDGISAVVTVVVEALTTVFAGPPWWVWLVLLTLGALLVRGWGLAVFTLLGFALIDAFDLWQETMETLGVVLVAALIATAVGVPLGIWAARSRAVGAALRPLLDLMQTTPVFVYLIPAVFFFGIGVVPGVVATTIFSIPPAVRLTELGIRGVDPEVVEATHAFGAHPRQILREVQLPMALPSIMAGINQVIMLALSMVVVAGLAGADGLGTVVVSAVTQLDIAAGVEGGLAVVIVAIYLDRFTAALAERPGRGLLATLRARRGRAATGAPHPATKIGVAGAGAGA
ncbi:MULTISPECIES: ABC transporter permease [Pseudonocardia]|uniref:Glycine betaine transport system permease protein OpuAB n=2 Tax=Pseudonocardia TaxID=1847 RepID=A0A1Y2N2U0_PSEAH|nr:MULTISPECIES: ABC transporter permease subunit [Pseudonocardia]OSY41784.1 Glycine betaine transport system permease protein OpuAB [Pseudonocardia autotrophica]TDN71165.1 glycine betaine/proline transport system permease protein [Pseudonocardia autotrophica]BBG01834.1 glycine/betaine ABC transporter permease [Pseudonocardia autotrophica]GEC23000.1 glycine/betaine ABC transporter permease [Pseudonocardia saturnea]